MNNKIPLLLLFAVVCLTQSYQHDTADLEVLAEELSPPTEEEIQDPQLSTELDDVEPAEAAIDHNEVYDLAAHEFAFDGKNTSVKSVKQLYTSNDLNEFEFPAFSKEVIYGLRQQLKLLKRKKQKYQHELGDLSVNLDQLEETIHILLETDVDFIKDALAAHRIKGKDGRGNVHFTGYFTPVLKVKKTADAVYKYPFYTRPKNWVGKLPTREQIDGEGVLKNKGLELAYAKNLVDIYFMQVQGSGVVEYPDGSQQLFAFDGSNGHRYRSIGKYMIAQGITTPENVSLTRLRKFFDQNPALLEEVLFVNSSYVFFTPAKSMKTTGAGVVPLTTDYSIAVDPRYIPLGSCVLAAVPVLDKRRNFSHHEFRLLLAQDIGGAIKGAGHVDLYTGVGRNAQRKASALHHYGGLWLLLPKDKKES
ncbi:MAG: murein transglycosylase A [Saprospiraceae bacterium]